MGKRFTQILMASNLLFFSLVISLFAQKNNEQISSIKKNIPQHITRFNDQFDQVE